MSDAPNVVAIHIMDKEYMVACPDEEREELMESAKYLDGRMKETRDGGKVLGAERMAIMTALNIVHDYLRVSRERDELERFVSERITQMNAKLNDALGRRAEEEGVD